MATQEPTNKSALAPKMLYGGKKLTAKEARKLGAAPTKEEKDAEAPAED